MACATSGGDPLPRPRGSGAAAGLAILGPVPRPPPPSPPDPPGPAGFALGLVRTASRVLLLAWIPWTMWLGLRWRGAPPETRDAGALHFVMFGLVLPLSVSGGILSLKRILRERR